MREQLSSSEIDTQPITNWLQAARHGNDEALGQLFEAVYPLLHRMASAKPGVERQGALTPTTVVNELFLKIRDSAALDVSDRHHFYATCSRAMRFIVADFARAAMSRKRGGDYDHCAYTQALAAQPDRAQELLDIHAALDELNQLDPRLRELVEMKFFGGLTYVEIGKLHDRSERSIKRDWRKARAFLSSRARKSGTLR
ncbi:MAG: sigma-70 family RNA polymerase sigma factor [Xanthomonadales bacterium]|nr:sigma-70 family RNA polymerase sigma factor [Xanthomonadales bacterium]